MQIKLTKTKEGVIKSLEFNPESDLDEKIVKIIFGDSSKLADMMRLNGHGEAIMHYATFVADKETQATDADLRAVFLSL